MRKRTTCSFCNQSYGVAHQLIRGIDDALICKRCCTESIRLLEDQKRASDAHERHLDAPVANRDPLASQLAHYRRFLYVNMLTWCAASALPICSIALMYTNGVGSGAWYGVSFALAFVGLFATSFFTIAYRMIQWRYEALANAVISLLIVAILQKIHSSYEPPDPVGSLLICLWAELVAVIQGGVAAISLFKNGNFFFAPRGGS